MANDTTWKSGDDTNVILRKILETLQGTGTVGTTGVVEANTRKLTLVDDFVSVGGDLAAAVTDSGSPVKVGGRASAATEPAAVSTGQRVNAFFDVFGRQVIVQAGKDTVNCYTSAARTASPTTMGDQPSTTQKGLYVIINVTAVTATPDVIVKIQNKDPLSGTYIDILATASISTTGVYTMILYPGLTAVVGTSPRISDFLLRTWRIVSTHGDTDSITYSVNATLLV